MHVPSFATVSARLLPALIPAFLACTSGTNQAPPPGHAHPSGKVAVSEPPPSPCPEHYKKINLSQTIIRTGGLATFTVGQETFTLEVRFKPEPNPTSLILCAGKVKETPPQLDLQPLGDTIDIVSAPADFLGRLPHAPELTLRFKLADLPTALTEEELRKRILVAGPDLTGSWTTFAPQSLSLDLEHRSEARSEVKVHLRRPGKYVAVYTRPDRQ